MAPKKTINILMIDQAVTFGGSIVVMANIANNLQDDFHCTVIYEIPHSMGNFLFRNNVKKYRVYNLLNYHVAGSIASKIRAFKSKALRLLCFKSLAASKYISSLIQIIRISIIIMANNIKIVHSNNSREAIIAASLLRRKIVLHLHGGVGGKNVKDPVRNKANTYIAISKCVAEQAISKHYDKDKITTIPNPVVLKEVDINRKNFYMEKFNINKTQKVFGIVGRIIDWKGQLEFLDAVSIVASKMDNVKILIIGDSSDGDEQYLKKVKAKILKLNLQNNVTITGYIEDIHNIMANLNVLVHCSIGIEPFGLVITEAMSLGIPVIAADFGAPIEIVKNAETGYLVNPNNATKLSEYIIKILCDKNLESSLGKSAKDDVLRRYNIKCYIKNISQLYKSLL